MEIVKDFQFFICWRYTFWSPRTKESRKKCKNSGLKAHVFERFLFGHASNALYCNILFPVPNSLRKKSRQVLVSLPKHIHHTKHLLESIKTQIIQIQLLLSFISTVLTSSIIHSRKKRFFHSSWKVTLCMCISHFITNIMEYYWNLFIYYNVKWIFFDRRRLFDSQIVVQQLFRLFLIVLISYVNIWERGFFIGVLFGLGK